LLVVALAAASLSGAGRAAPTAIDAGGLVTVIVDLRLPPLAAETSRIEAAVHSRRLDARAAPARAYLARLAVAQRAARAELAAAIPSARVTGSYRIVLDALAVDLPADRLDALSRLGFVSRIYASIRYTLALDRSPGVIGADVLQRTTGATGAGVKIAIVDDGIDERNPFFAPGDLTYPPGFPKGNRAYTTPKVIVARSFPGPGSGAPGRLPLDPHLSFHGTHVAGIAAGDAGTNAPAGADHPAVAGLSGIAPRAYLGNYRVFTVPTKLGPIAETPAVVAAFEAAAADGMDVVNFSGGGPEIDPRSDALVEAIHNLTRAGIVTVVAAGNDRDQFGYGTIGSPATAPDAIAVAAVSNSHVFAPALTVVAAGAPTTLHRIPVQGTFRSPPPVEWSSGTTPIVDVGSLHTTAGQGVDRYLCGSRKPRAGSLHGAIALALRGLCPFTEKADAARRAGATGLLLVDNRPGEANTIPVELSLPAGMIADLDGKRLIAYLDGRGGRARIRLSRDPLEIDTGRSGVVTSFSAGGPTAFAHALKPDVAAPGGQVLSSTTTTFDESGFAVLDGTSMATPHVAGAAALLLQEHTGWTPALVRSALVSSAGPAWADTARTRQASVLLAGGGLVDLPAADNPLLFTNPVTLSLGMLEASSTPLRRDVTLQVADAGGGDGTWTVTVRPQARSAGTTVSAPADVQVPAGGSATLNVTVTVNAGAAPGADSGFVVLSRDGSARRIPYDASVSRPQLAHVPVHPLGAVERGDTSKGASHVAVYELPTAPFGLPSPPTGRAMDESGAESVYSFTLEHKDVNAGVRVTGTRPGSRIDVFILGALDENQVEGYGGIPIDVNELSPDFGDTIGAASLALPQPGRYYVAVDSERALGGPFVLHFWVNDTTPPAIRLLTTSVATGRPVLAARITDAGSGVDPGAIELDVSREQIPLLSYDPASGLALFRPETDVEPGPVEVKLVAADYQEAKNIETPEKAILPNTRTQSEKVQVTRATVVTWLEPAPGACVPGGSRLTVTASAPGAPPASVEFRVDGTTLGSVQRDRSGLYRISWKPTPGRHQFSALAGSASATVSARTCG
jgi:subtilisin family serine protease